MNDSQNQVGQDAPPVPNGFPAASPVAAPSDFFPPASPTPPRSPINGKIVATFLGLALMVGGVGAGVVLVSQPQLLEQQAAGLTYTTCSSGMTQCLGNTIQVCSSGVWKNSNTCVSPQVCNVEGGVASCITPVVSQIPNICQDACKVTGSSACTACLGTLKPCCISKSNSCVVPGSTKGAPLGSSISFQGSATQCTGSQFECSKYYKVTGEHTSVGNCVGVPIGGGGEGTITVMTCKEKYGAGAYPLQPLYNCSSETTLYGSTLANYCPANLNWLQAQACKYTGIYSETYAVNCCVPNTSIQRWKDVCKNAQVSANTTLISSGSLQTDIANGLTAGIDTSRFSNHNAGEIIYSASATETFTDTFCQKGRSSHCLNDSFKGILDIKGYQITSTTQVCDYTSTGSKDGYCCK